MMVIVMYYGLGLPKGQRDIQDINIPEFIFKSNDEIKSIFLRQALDDEGYVYVRGKIVGFSINEKVSKLDSTLNSYKQEQFEDWREIVVAIVNNLSLQGGFFTSKDLIRKTNRSREQVRYYIKMFLKEGRIEVVEKSKSTGNGMTFVKYVSKSNTS